MPRPSAPRCASSPRSEPEHERAHQHEDHAERRGDAQLVEAQARHDLDGNRPVVIRVKHDGRHKVAQRGHEGETPDRKSTRLNSSHGYISYAVFCLKKKKKNARRLSGALTQRMVTMR